MKRVVDHKLDNPAWNSLSEIHREFAVDSHTSKFYHPDCCPFGGTTDLTGCEDDLEKYSTLVENFFMIGKKPSLPRKLFLKNELVCLQMIIDTTINLSMKSKIVALKQEHRDALYDLVNLVQPGYFKKKTALLGDYFGIFDNNQLIAVTGERMKMKDFTEVSAVITRPGPELIQ